MRKTLLIAALLIPFAIAFCQPSTFKYHGLAGGGAQYAPSINPNNPGDMYVACDMSGLYHSVDTGNTWNILSFRQMQASHPSMVQYTNSPDTLYCITFNNNDGNGYTTKSTDGGLTWNFTTDATSGNGVWLIYANPQNEKELLVTDYSDIYYSTDGGITFGSAFYTDTTGAGAYIAGVLWEGSTIYICTNIGLMVSTNSGASWSKPTMPGINPLNEWIVSCAGAKSGNTVRFFCVTQANGDVYVGETGDNNYGYMNVYEMDYGVTNWTKRETGILSNDLPFFVSMAANNINVAYLAGNDNNTQFPEVLKTSDSGMSWSHVFGTNNNQNIETGWEGDNGDQGWGFDQYAFGLNVCLSDTSTVVLTGEGFTHLTTDGGKTWRAAYVQRADLNPANASTPDGKYYHPNGLEVTSNWDIMWYDSLSMFSGCTDITALRSKDGGNSWAEVPAFGYNTVYKFLTNPSNHVIYAATSSIHDMYMSTRLTDGIIDGGTGNIQYSTNGGNTFNQMYNFGHPVIWMAVDPTDSNRMYASVINHSGGKGGIWVSNNIQLNAGATWTQCAAPARTQGHPFNVRVLNDGTLLASYSGRINSSGKFTDSSGVFISTNQGASWTDRSDPGMQYWTMDVVIDPWDTTQNTWYAGVFDNWGGPNNTLGGLYRTTNRGVNWTRIDTLSWVYSITFDPIHQGQAYITTQQEGLWFSSNIEATNPTITLLHQYPFREPNRTYFNPYNPNEVWINSFGNGIQMGNLLGTGINEVKGEGENVKVYPNPNNGTFTIVMNSFSGDKTTLQVYNMLGEEIYTTGLTAKSTQVNIGVQPKVVYLYKVTSQTSGLIGEGKIVLQ